MHTYMCVYACTCTYLSLLRSCTSSTMMCETDCKCGSLSSLRSNIPVVQNNSLVDDDILLSKRIWGLGVGGERKNLTDHCDAIELTTNNTNTDCKWFFIIPLCKFRTMKAKIVIRNIPHFLKFNRMKKTVVIIL